MKFKKILLVYCLWSTTGVGNLLNYSTPHSVLKRFQRAATIQPDQKKGLGQKFRPFFGRIGGEDHKKMFSLGDENHFVDLLLHIYHKKKSWAG